MGRILRDIAEEGLAEMLKKYLVNAILPRPEANINCWEGKDALKVLYFYCKVCGRDLAMVLSSNDGEIHLPLNPCTRVVLGIHPEVEKSIDERYGRQSPFVGGTCQYLCGSCTGMKLPERMHNLGVTARIEDLKRDPIIDMRVYEKGKGCWITATEFPLNGQLGRFINLQTNFEEFVSILMITDLMKRNDLLPFSSRRSS